MPEIRGWRCEVKAPDDTVLVRKCATSKYAYALIAYCATWEKKESGYHGWSESKSWKLIGMSATWLGAKKLSKYSRRLNYTVVPVSATPVMVERRPRSELKP